MSIGFLLLRTYMKVLSTIAPSRAINNATNIFFSPKQHEPKEWENEAEKKGDRVWIDENVSCIVWGEGEPVLLMHGWEGRATQMSVLIPYLADNYKLIALDAPGHGVSKGSTSNPHEFIKAIFKAQEKFGEFKAIVGHSMGGGCSVYSALEGLKVNKVVSISGPAYFRDVVSLFGKFIGLGGTTHQKFLNRVEQHVDLTFDQLSLAKRINPVKHSILIIHDIEDKEVPYNQALKYEDILGKDNVMTTTGLGHRQIMRDNKVLQKVADFIND
jgi:esterase/lipase